MKNMMFITLTILLVVSTSGCTRTSYAIHTNDGRTIVSDSKPKEADSGLVAYIDANGIKKQINKKDVKSVSEIQH